MEDRSKNPRFVVVDENDTIIGYKERDALAQKDIYRVSSLWVTNSKGEILLARRGLTKSHDPGKWGPAVAGTVEEGEDYRTNILKEAEEEIGLKDIEPQVGSKERRTGDYNYFVQQYFLTIDKTLDQFIINRREVEELKWFSEKDLLREIDNAPSQFLKSVKRCVLMFSK